MGKLVEEAIQTSGDSIGSGEKKLAKHIAEDDQKINVLEIEIDELGHELIALFQPTAVDLRFITMILKINSDLERIGDQAVNIAEKGIDLDIKSRVTISLDLPAMVKLSIEMVKDALEAFSSKDAQKAKLICERDDQLDDWNRKVNDELQGAVEKEDQSFAQAISLIMIAHNLERIGDLATNIAEDVIYLAKGIDIRHHITERRD